MNIIIKLIGHFIIEDNNKYIYELKLFNVPLISFDMMKTVLSSYGLEEEHFENITITCDCKNIKNENIIITSSLNNDEKKIYIYTCKENTRNELKEIFITYGYKILIQTDVNILSNNDNKLFDNFSKLNISLNNNLTDILSDEINNDLVDEINNDLDNEINNDLDNEINNDLDNDFLDNEINNDLVDEINNDLVDEIIDFKEINEETIKTFDDEDFIFLIKIYINKPTIFKKFFKYISSGNIILNNSNNSNNYDINNSVEFIKNLNIGISDDVIIDALNKTNNHLNLSIRYILFKKIEQNT